MDAHEGAHRVAVLTNTAAGEALDGDISEHGSPCSPARSSTPSILTDSDLGCSCCPSLGESEQGLIQRRSLGNIKRPLLSGKEDDNSSKSSRLMQERILWVILVLACTALILSVFPVEYPYTVMSTLGALANNIADYIVPQGATRWNMQWRFRNGTDPRPLWDTTLVGSGTDWPHGSAASFAEALGGGDVKRVAVVGNGPVSEAQREDIEQADKIVRFNAMNNRRLDERVDIWIVRYNRIPPYGFWGFQQLEDGEIEGVVKQASAIMFLGGSMKYNSTEMFEAVEKVHFWFPDISEKQMQQVNFTGYWDVYNKMFSKTGSTTIDTADTMPSSGLLGLLAVLDAVGSAVRVDLYGFNWSSKSYVAHKMSAEELIIRELRKHFPNVFINPTACNGLYSCESICDTGQFRLAVDETNCIAQAKRARQGAPVRFIDHHTIHNLDWYPELKQELNIKPLSGGSKAQQQAWLKNLTDTLTVTDDRTRPAISRLLPPDNAVSGAKPGGVTRKHLPRRMKNF